MRTNRNRPVFWIVILVLVSSVACRLEFGFGPEAADQSEVLSASSVLSQQKFTRTTSSPTPQPTDAALPTETATATVPLETPTPSPTLTTTSTPVNKLIPTTTARNGISLAPTSTPGLIVPTPTAIPLMPARYPPRQIIVPAIGLDAPVASAGWKTVIQNGTKTSIWEIPDNAAGWHKNSALPGHNNNVVISGHHNLGNEVFRGLVELDVGDEITLLADVYEFHYRITDRFIVPERDAPPEQRQQNAQWIMPTIDERLTLVTCWPYHDNSHRLVVVAKPSGYTQ